MAQTILFVNSFSDQIPPDQTMYFNLGPDARFKGAVTVTAHPHQPAVSFPEQHYIEVVQMATRGLGGGPGESRMLDIVVRNNSHVGDPGATTILGFDVFTAVVS